jgi:capsular polysaccharide biosynthesis protein
VSAEQQNNEEVTIDLRRLFILIRKHIISILIWMIGLGLIAYGVSEYVLVPKYTASTQLLVNRKTAEQMLTRLMPTSKPTLTPLLLTRTLSLVTLF